MAVTNASELASFDADGVRRTVQETVSSPLYSLFEYTTSSFRPLYIHEQTIATYENKDEMLDHFEKIHTNVHMDFMQVELFRNTLFPEADRVEYITTAMDFLKILRVYVGDEGLLLALHPDEPVEPIVEAIKAEIDWPPNQNQ